MSEAAATQGRCLTCLQTCSLNGAPPDGVLGGMPCQGFSFQRPNHASIPAHKHNAFEEIFVNTIEYLRTRKPRGGILENVLGFAAPLVEMPCASEFPPKFVVPKRKPASWRDYFVELLEGLDDAVQTVILDQKWIIDCPRNRFSAPKQMAFIVSHQNPRRSIGVNRFLIKICEGQSAQIPASLL